MDGSAWPQATAVFDASRHRMLSDARLGDLVSTIGYTGRRPSPGWRWSSATSGAAAACAVLELIALDAALAVMCLALIGQDIVGGEWLFSGYEVEGRRVHTGADCFAAGLV